MESGKKPGRPTIHARRARVNFLMSSTFPTSQRNRIPMCTKKRRSRTNRRSPTDSHDVPQAGDAKEQALWGALLTIPAVGAAATLALSKKKPLPRQARKASKSAAKRITQWGAPQNRRQP